MINKIAIFFFKLFLYPAVFLKRKFSRKNFNSYNPKSILLVNTTGIGDIILSAPAWQFLRKIFPDAFISVMVHERRRDVVVHNPIVDNIIVYRKFAYFLRLIKELRRLKIDAAIIFHGNDPDILPLVFLGGARQIIGYKRRTKLPYFLTTPLQNLPDHFIMAQMRLAERVAGGEETEFKDLSLPIFFLNGDEKKKARLFLEENNLIGKPLIGILPGAGRPYKCWPAERFAAVVIYLLQKLNVCVIIFGSKKEMALAKKIEGLSAEHFQKKEDYRIINAAGSFNLRQASALMERLNLFIANDSGPLHIAMALNVPAVALFCPTDPRGLLPPGENSRIKIIKKDIPCKPCITKRCRHPFCMEQISVDEVIKAVEGLIYNENIT